MRISSQLLTNELVLRFLSEPPQFSTNPPTVALLPCSEWWAIACKCWGDSAEISTYIHWCIIDNLWREAWSVLTMAKSGLSLWDCDRHGELFSKFLHNLLTFFVGDQKVGHHHTWSRKLRLWITQIQIEARWHIMHVTAPWRGGRSAHCTLWHWIFWNFAKATRQALALCSLPSTWGEEGDTGVTSINNYPDTAHRGLGRPWGRHDVTTGDGCVCCTGLPGLRAGLRGDLGHVFGRNDT